MLWDQCAGGKTDTEQPGKTSHTKLHWLHEKSQPEGRLFHVLLLELMGMFYASQPQSFYSRQASKLRSLMGSSKSRCNGWVLQDGCPTYWNPLQPYADLLSESQALFLHIRTFNGEWVVKSHVSSKIYCEVWKHNYHCHARLCDSNESCNKTTRVFPCQQVSSAAGYVTSLAADLFDMK